MIDRYAYPPIAELFTLTAKYQIWQDIEIAAVEAHYQYKLNEVSADDLKAIKRNAGFDVQHIDELEATLNHDVIAFLTDLGEHIDKDVKAGGSKPSRWVHFGMTSSDLGDTALARQITKALEIILQQLSELGKTAQALALQHKDLICVGRTHGIHAEPMLFGMKPGAWAFAIKRAIVALGAAREVIAVGEISGAVGTYSSIDPRVEAYVCEKLGLVPDQLSTQVLARDRHAQVANALAQVAAVLENVATEIRALQKTDTIEVEEPFNAGQKGSSAMPHKRNPIICERIVGMARVIKANAQVSLNNVALWHERDISHSAAERIALTDSLIALGYIIDKANYVLSGLKVYPARCKHNLEKTKGLIYSSKVLLSLIDSGMSREDAYSIVQENAMAVWSDIQDGVEESNLLAKLLSDKRNTLSQVELENIFNPTRFLQHTSVIFDRIKALEF